MEKTEKEKALEIAKLLTDMKGENVVVLDISKLNSWTNYFVIVTVASGIQAQGFYKAVKDYINDNGLEIHQTSQKSQQGDDWNLIDAGNIVIHLMSPQAREFYDLEKLWHAGERLN